MKATMSADGTVTFVLTHAEALVLFDLLFRIESRDVARALGVVDDAEELVLWRLSGSLEPLLVEPINPDHRELVEAARAEVRGAH